MMADSLRERKLTIRHANGVLNLIATDIADGLIKRFRREDVYASCLTCLNFRNQTQTTGPPQLFYCTKYNTYPPIHILINSCEVGYDDNDDIPF